jgi:DNA-binding NarL/FixJ family response regulator
MSHRVSVYVTATDPILRTGVSSQLRGRPDVEVRSEPDAAVAVVVTDVFDENTVRLVRQTRADHAGSVLVVLSVVDDTAMFAAIEAGACGIVPRAEATPERLADAVCKAAAKGGVLSPDLVGRLLGQVSRLQNQVLSPKGVRLSGLSDRETTVLRMIAQGMEVREIAVELNYSERTIKNTMHDIVARFQLRNRTHAVAFAMREGLI